jgi:bacterioferritin
MAKAAKSDKDTRRAKVIEVLNQARSMELHGISQYMNQHYALDNMDYGELARDMKLIAIDEMRHAEQFAERIKELGGEPTTEMAAKVTKGQDVRKIFPFDAALEDDTIDVYNQFLKICQDCADNQTAKLFEAIIEEEQAHYNHFDNVGNHIKTLGDTFLSKIAGTPASTGGAAKGFVLPGA